MTLLLKMSRVGVKRESMEKEEVEGVGEDGETREAGRSRPTRGRDGEGLSRSFGLTARGRCVLERSRAGGRGEVRGEGVERSTGLEGFCRSMLGARLLKGLLTLFMYISISSARSRRAVGVLLLSWSLSCCVSAVIRDRGSKPISIPVLVTAPPLQLTLLSTLGFCFPPSPSSSSTPCSLSAARWCCLVQLRFKPLSPGALWPPDKSREVGLSFFGRAP